MTVVLRIKETTEYPCGARKVAKGWILAWLGIGYTRQLAGKRAGCPVHGWSCAPGGNLAEARRTCQHGIYADLCTSECIKGGGDAK